MSFWDERYNEPGYAYGTDPNDFLVEMVRRIPGKQVLSLAEGEGRNALFLARNGLEVTAVDSSSVGLSKAEKLAQENGFFIHTIHTDLAHLEIEPEAWDGVVSIFCHLPPEIRVSLHRKVVAGLRPGGVLILEAYTPRQLEFRTGGPADAALTMQLEDLKKEFAGLEFDHALEIDREVMEGKYHHGRAAVVQLVAHKPG